MNTSDDTTDQARDFVRQIFGRSNKVQINDDGITAEDLNTLFTSND